MYNVFFLVTPRTSQGLYPGLPPTPPPAGQPFGPPPPHWTLVMEAVVVHLRPRSLVVVVEASCGPIRIHRLGEMLG